MTRNQSVQEARDSMNDPNDTSGSPEAPPESEEPRRLFLMGQKLYLRPLEESDIGPEYVNWLNDHDVTRYMGTGRFPSTKESIRKFLSRFENSTTDLALAIIDREQNQHIGNVTLNHINWIDRTADTGLMIGRKEFWGKGYAYEAWRLILTYAFSQLGLRKVVAGAVVENVASVGTLRKLGFKLEGTFREEVLVDGKPCDTARFGLLRREFQSDV